MKKQSKDLSPLFDYNIDPANNLLYLGSYIHPESGEYGIDHAVAEFAIKGLEVLDRQEHKNPITIIMNNPGGSWYHGMAIYDAIKACNSETAIVVYGMAMSMAGLILQAADQRIMTPNSTFMMHYGTNAVEDHAKNFVKWADHEKRLQSVMEEIFLNRIKEKKPEFTKTRVKKLLDFDTILNAQEAVEMGLADAVQGKAT